MSNNKKKPNNNANNKPVYKKWYFWVIIVIAIFIVIGICGGSKDEGETNQSESVKVDSGNKKQHNLGEAFTFSGVELTISPKYSITTLSNEFSEDNGKSVVVLPTTVKNVSEEPTTLNMFSYKIYGPQGTETKTVSSYFQEESVDFGGNLQPNASYTKNLYFLYDGDGTYKIDFGVYSVDATVSIDIAK